VLLLGGEDALEHPAGGRIVLGDVADHLTVGVDGDPLGTRSSLIMSTRSSPSIYSEWLRVRRPSGLRSGSPPSWVMRSAMRSRGLLLVGVLEELLGHSLRVDARGHVVVALVAEHTDELGGERLVEKTQDGLAIAR